MSKEGKLYTSQEVYNKTNKAYTGQHVGNVYNEIQDASYRTTSSISENDIHNHPSQTTSNYLCSKDVADQSEQLYNRRESDASNKLEKRDSSESGYETKRTSRESSSE